MRDEDGVSAGVDSEAVTGCSSDGTADPDAPLGADSVRTGWALSPGYELSFQSRDNSDAYKVYGLSEVFEVGVASTGATLSGLALEDASINRTIALTPSTFAATTTSYTASVARGVGEITVKPTVNESNATFVFLDGSDSRAHGCGHEPGRLPGLGASGRKHHQGEGDSRGHLHHGDLHGNGDTGGQRRTNFHGGRHDVAPLQRDVRRHLSPDRVEHPHTGRRDGHGPRQAVLLPRGHRRGQVRHHSVERPASDQGWGKIRLRGEVELRGDGQGRGW